MHSSIAAVVALSAIAVVSCNEKTAPPDAEFKPGPAPVQASTEATVAGSGAKAGTSSATPGGSAAKPGATGLATIAALQGKPMIVRATRPL
jgi:hypothetical protein